MATEVIVGSSVESARRRIENIDMVRGVAATCVMVQHSINRARFDMDVVADIVRNWLDFGQVGVVAFFLVSGFVIPLSLERSNSVFRFWVSRAVRIYPLYVFAIVVGLLCRGSRVDCATIVANLAFVQEYLGVENLVGNSWTLSLEMCWYVLFSMLFIFGVNRKPSVITVVSCVSILCGIVVTLAVGVRVPLGRLGLIATCSFGLLLYRWRDGKQRSECIMCMIAIGAVIVCGNYVGCATRPQAAASSFRCVMFSWGMAYLLFAASFVIVPSKSVAACLKGLGVISYSIYLNHVFVFWILSRTSVSGVAYVATVCILTCGLSVITYYMIEKPPIALLQAYWLKRQQRRAECRLVERV